MARIIDFISSSSLLTAPLFNCGDNQHKLVDSDFEDLRKQSLLMLRISLFPMRSILCRVNDFEDSRTSSRIFVTGIPFASLSEKIKMCLKDILNVQ